MVYKDMGKGWDWGEELKMSRIIFYVDYPGVLALSWCAEACRNWRGRISVALIRTRYCRFWTTLGPPLSAEGAVLLNGPGQ
jgi:hypothetical protein